MAILLRAVAGGVLGVDPEEEVEVDRRRELGRPREPAHLRIVPVRKKTQQYVQLPCYRVTIQNGKKPLDVRQSLQIV